MADDNRIAPQGMCDVVADMTDLAENAFVGFGVQSRVVIRVMRLTEE
jgi:hypothetical protein